MWSLRKPRLVLQTTSLSTIWLAMRRVPCRHRKPSTKPSLTRPTSRTLSPRLPTLFRKLKRSVVVTEPEVVEAVEATPAIEEPSVVETPAASLESEEPIPVVEQVEDNEYALADS